MAVNKRAAIFQRLILLLQVCVGGVFAASVGAGPSSVSTRFGELVALIDSALMSDVLISLTARVIEACVRPLVEKEKARRCSRPRRLREQSPRNGIADQTPKLAPANGKFRQLRPVCRYPFNAAGAASRLQ